MPKASSTARMPDTSQRATTSREPWTRGVASMSSFRGVSLCEKHKATRRQLEWQQNSHGRARWLRGSGRTWSAPNSLPVVIRASEQFVGHNLPVQGSHREPA